MKTGYAGEQDLFVARICFEVLVRNYKMPVNDIQAMIDQIKAGFPA